MDSDRWKQVPALVEEARALLPEERKGFLEGSCPEIA